MVVQVEKGVAEWFETTKSKITPHLNPTGVMANGPCDESPTGIEGPPETPGYKSRAPGVGVGQPLPWARSVWPFWTSPPRDKAEPDVREPTDAGNVGGDLQADFKTKALPGVEPRAHTGRGSEKLRMCDWFWDVEARMASRPLHVRRGTFLRKPHSLYNPAPSPEPVRFGRGWSFQSINWENPSQSGPGPHIWGGRVVAPTRFSGRERRKMNRAH